MPVARLEGASWRRGLSLAFTVFAAALSHTAQAQPADLPIAAATTDHYPPGVHVVRTPQGQVYADAGGHVLYGMDMRMLLRLGPDASTHCTAECAQTWNPLLAPAGTAPNIAYPRAPRFARAQPSTGMPYTQQNAPDWTVIAGPQGPQWVYKGWHMVFTRRGDSPGSTAFEGAEDKTWNTLKYIAPAPKLEAPDNVRARVVNGDYVLSDPAGRVLFTGDCGSHCSGWRPLAAGMASGPVGKWSVRTDGDVPQWTYRGKAVYVSEESDPKTAPPSGVVLRPDAQ